MTWLKSLSVVTSLAAASLPAFAKPAQEIRDEESAGIPVCAKKLGAISVVEPKTDWWREAGLGSPEGTSMRARGECWNRHGIGLRLTVKQPMLNESVYSQYNERPAPSRRWIHGSGGQGDILCWNF